MTAIGLELRDGVAEALAVDSRDGRIVERATIESKDDLARLAAEAVDAIARATGQISALGVASVMPGPTGCGEMLALAVRQHWRHLEHVIPSGAAAAVAEAWVGAARDVCEVAWLGASDHASAGLVRDGVPVFGARRRACSVGWLALNPVEREDYRKTGCLEAEVGGAGIVRRLIWRVKAGDRSRVSDAVGGDFAAITVAQILDAARAGDGVAVSVVRDTAKYLGMAAANLVAIADPERLVLAGIMASSSDLLFEPVRAEMAKRLPRETVDALTIVPAALGADAPAIGAARLAAAAR